MDTARTASDRETPAPLPPAQTRRAPGDQWDSVRPAYRLPVAVSATRIRGVVAGIRLVSTPTGRWHLGSGIAKTSRNPPDDTRQEPRTQRRYSRFPIGEDGAKRGQRGFDVGKKTKGRKRHIAVDTLGNLLAVVVHSAGIQDRLGARAVLCRLFAFFTTIQTLFADGGYTGTLIPWTKAMFVWTLTVVKPTETHRFVVFAQALDRRAHLRLVCLVATPEQRLRTSHGLLGSPDQARHDSSAGKTVSVSYANRFLDVNCAGGRLRINKFRPLPKH